MPTAARSAPTQQQNCLRPQCAFANPTSCTELSVPSCIKSPGRMQKSSNGSYAPLQNQSAYTITSEQIRGMAETLIALKTSELHASLSLKAGLGQLQCTTALNSQALISPSAGSYGVLYIDTIDRSGNCLVRSRPLLSHTGLHVTDSAHASSSPGKYSFVKTSASLGSLRSSKVPALPDRRSSKLALSPSTCRGCGLKCCYVSEHIVTPSALREPSPLSQDDHSTRVSIPVGNLLHALQTSTMSKGEGPERTGARDAVASVSSPVSCNHFRKVCHRSGSI